MRGKKNKALVLFSDSQQKQSQSSQRQPHSWAPPSNEFSPAGLEHCSFTQPRTQNTTLLMSWFLCFSSSSQKQVACFSSWTCCYFLMDMAMKKKKNPHTAQWQHFHIIKLEEGALVGMGRGRRGLNKEINFSLKALKGEGMCEWLFNWHH